MVTLNLIAFGLEPIVAIVPEGIAFQMIGELKALNKEMALLFKEFKENNRAELN
jgi:hypothetical protein